MVNNAYKENTIEINGKEIVIPEMLNYAQIINCELRGLTITDVQKKPLFAVAVIFSVLANISVNDAVNALDQAFNEGLKVSDFMTEVIPSYTNFFAQHSNKE